MNDHLPVRFGAFELDLRTRELRKHGIRLKLQDQPFQVLQALVERPGELVTREELQHKIWAGDTFVDFEQSLNRAVNKVREALGDGAGTPRYIETLPRRGYRFIAEVESDGTPEPPARTATRTHSRFAWLAVILAAGGIAVWLARDRGTPTVPRVAYLTTLAGTANHPAFSPDGKQLAFQWNGEKQDNFDVYIKVIGDVRVLRLTEDPAEDGYPAWSPDGKEIAFASKRGGGGIYIVSPLGGGERKVADLATDSRLSWTADGKYLVAAELHRDLKPDAGSLMLVSADGSSTPRKILAPSGGTWYREPAISFRGRSLAFAACNGPAIAPACDIQVARLRPGPELVVPARTITRMSTGCRGLAWTADESSLLYSTGTSGQFVSLWRVSVNGGRTPERLEVAGTYSYYPAVDGKSGRVAFVRRTDQADIWRMDIGRKPFGFLASSLRDANPQYSPDGRRIAFDSARGGERIAIWVASADGSGVEQLTRGESLYCGSPHWSPDGSRVAFDAMRTEGLWHVWVMDANGTVPRQLTTGPSNNAAPNWSRDGKWIYFTSNRSGRSEIWRAPAEGRTAEKVTSNGGYVAAESADGKTLYFTVSESGSEGLYAKSLPDGEEKQLFRDNVSSRGFAVFSDGIYYIHERGPTLREIRFYSLWAGSVRVLGEIDGPMSLGLTVSPDRRTFLFAKYASVGRQLMLIENFR